jgi:ribosomal-protein-alanine N-acetyltransferase
MSVSRDDRLPIAAGALAFDTPRLALREFTEDDAPFVLRLLNEPSFHEFIGDRGVRSIADACRYLREGPMASYRAHGHGLLRVALRDGGEVIGMCGLVRRDTLPLPDLGFALVPEAWGAGYTTEAGRAVLEHGRKTLGLREVLAITSPGNERSMRVLQKLGMALEDRRSLSADAAPVNVFRVRMAGPALG